MAHNNKSPAYIGDVTLPVSRDLSRSRLRSADTTDFIVPRTRTKFGERAFCVSGPIILNSLPQCLQTITRTATFKPHLKSHIFNFFIAFNLLFHCTDCIARPIRFVVDLALNIYNDDDYDDDDDDDNKL